MRGALNLFKPPGCSSHDLVQQVRRSLQIRRVGHCGTLDPGAGGVVVVLVGRATRLQQYLMQLGKVYTAELTFGITTDSGDGFGKVTARGPVPSGPAELRGVLEDFTGEVEQVPPMTSAVKHGGVPLYRLAHRGISVRRDPRLVTIEEIKILDWRPGPLPRALLQITCSSGTYVRVLLEDLARAAGYPGYMSFLVRERIGHFSADKATFPHCIDRLHLISPAEALGFMKQVPLQDEDVRLVANGARPRQVDTDQLPFDEPLCLVNPCGDLAAVAHIQQTADGTAQIRLQKVFAKPDG